MTPPLEILIDRMVTLEDGVLTVRPPISELTFGGADVVVLPGDEATAQAMKLMLRTYGRALQEMGRGKMGRGIDAFAPLVEVP